MFVGDSNPIWKNHTCDFLCKSGKESKRCGLVFPSKNKLNVHKREANHLQRKRKYCTSTKVAASEPKQLKLDDIVQPSVQRQEEDEAADNVEEVDEEICYLCKIYSCQI